MGGEIKWSELVKTRQESQVTPTCELSQPFPLSKDMYFPTWAPKVRVNLPLSFFRFLVVIGTQCSSTELNCTGLTGFNHHSLRHRLSLYKPSQQASQKTERQE